MSRVEKPFTLPSTSMPGGVIPAYALRKIRITERERHRGHVLIIDRNSPQVELAAWIFISSRPFERIHL